MKTILGRRYLPHAFPLEVLHCVHVERPSTLVMHSHDFAELTVVQSGHAVHHVRLPDGTAFSYPLAPGQVFLVNLGEEHTFALQGEPLTVENILFDPTILRYLPVQMNENLTGAQLLFSPSLPYAERYPFHPITDPMRLELLGTYIRLLNRETSGRSATGDAACLLLFFLLINTVGRCLEEHAVPVEHYAGPPHILRIIDHLEQHYNEDLTLEKLALDSGYSVRSLTAQFKQCTGETVIGFLHRLRIEKACYYLSCTAMSITEIALSVGFNNLSFFNKVFKTQTGQTPSQYRTALKQSLCTSPLKIR
ncbi:MAG: helix-turn-helix domain-containing protein [Clostridiales bacterium]|nr:helix-turn-helix domain-containing protein [Clostridiales bacterium]